jgi:aminoglycoside 3'-phosphotransferase-1
LAEHGGRTADEVQGPAIVTGERGLDALAAALHRLHDLPTEDCPFDASDQALLAEASRRVAAGLVSTEHLDAAYQRYGPVQLLELARASVPATPGPGPVVLHGDARLDHLELDATTGAGTWSSLGRLGVGDPYRDLATLTLDLVAGGAGSEVLGQFFEAYGIERPDVVRLDFHILLDQLLR